MTIHSGADAPIVATTEALTVFNTVLMIWLVYRVVTIHRMVDIIGEQQHMHMYHAEMLLDDRCDGLDDEDATWVYVEPGTPEAIEGTTAPYIMWDEGGSDE